MMNATGLYRGYSVKRGSTPPACGSPSGWDHQGGFRFGTHKESIVNRPSRRMLSDSSSSSGLTSTGTEQRRDEFSCAKQYINGLFYAKSMPEIFAPNTAAHVARRFRRARRRT